MKAPRESGRRHVKFTAGAVLATLLLPVPGSSVFAACVSPPSGIVSWWSGDGNAKDLVGVNNGMFENGAGYGTGEVGPGFSFSGTTNYVRIPASPSLDVGKSNGLTIEAWINPADLGQHPIVEWAPGGGYGGLVWINVQSSGSVYVDLHDSNGGEHLLQSGGGIVAANVLQHVAVTYDRPSGIGRVFVNGVQVAEATLGSFEVLTSSDLYLGYRPSHAPFGPYPYKGIIDEVSLYSRALTPAELQAIYNAGSAGKCPPPSCAPAPGGLVGWWRGEANTIDQAGTNHGTLVGNATYGAGRVGQGLVLDGSGDGMLVGNPASLQLQDFTIETWIKRASTTVASFDFNGGEIFGYGGGGYVLGMLDNGTPFLSRAEVDNVMPNMTIADTNLHHLAVTKLGTSVVFYVDGVAYAVPPYSTTYNFATPAAIGIRGDTLANSFFGTIDEVSVYNRPLSAAEVLAIYTAGENGKCVAVLAAQITSQPATQTAIVGETVTFNVTASGTAPLTYQWRWNGTNIIGATADTLVLTNVQLASAGVYSVVVSNSFGSTTSSNATLTVNPQAGCLAPPAGLVSWWRGEANALDQVGANNGTLVGNTTYGVGRVSQGFVFDGNADAVSLGNPATLQLQDFTIETWIKRASATTASFDPNGGGIFGYGSGGYILGMLDNGTPFLSRVGIDNVTPNMTIADTNLHHLAVTKMGTNVVFYVDGVAYLVPAYNTTYNFATPAAIGARGDSLANTFFGTIDEVSVYNRSLSAAEIQALYNAGGAGKCLALFPAFIVTQPANKSVVVGANTSFSVTAGGTPPFSYQWWFNGTSITNATNATLNLANIQFNQAGFYAVAVANAASSSPVPSSNATLAVTYPAARVRVVGTNTVSGRPVTLPIEVVANGNENALSFSLNYATARLAFKGAQLGAFPPGTYFYVNTSQTNFGRLGVTLALPSGATFAPGTQVVAAVTFDAAIWLSSSPTLTTVSFGDVPLVRGLTDVNALTLAATYTSGQVVLSGTDLEGDSIPRPGGSRSLTVNDWVQAGRFVAKLDIPAAGGEFQRADAAPRGMYGDGQISVMDWVQAGRYFAGWDPLTAVGGPSVEVTPTGPLGPDALRAVRVTGMNGIQGVVVSVPVTLQAQGNENGVGFTLNFDPAAFHYLSASLGGGAAGANFNLNTNQVASGKLGLALVLPTGSSFGAGTRELVQVNLLPTVVGSYPVALSDQLVLRGVSDPAAIELPASYITGNVVVNPHPTLLIARFGTNVILSWPALASGFKLQSSTNATVPGNWGAVLTPPQAEGDNLRVTLPVTDQTRYFRLQHP